MHSARFNYAPSGKFHPSRLVGSLAMLVATSAAVAVGFLILLLAGLHFPLIALVMPVMGLAACATCAVKYGQIRNPLLAAVLAASFGAVGYLGTFHLDQCWRWQAPLAAIDRLPAYIAFRMESDGWFFQRKFWVIHPLPANPNIQPQAGLAQIRPLSLHWLTLIAELGIFAVAPAIAAWLAAAAPFSEKRRRWMLSETLFLHPGAQASFQTALREQRLDEWVDASPPRVPQQSEHWRLTIWYAPSESGDQADADVFVQLDRTTYQQLFSAEAAALVTLLPGLLSMAGPARDELAAQAERTGGESARIWPVPAPHAGTLQTAGNWWRVQAMGALWFLGIPAAILGLGIGGCAVIAWLIQLGIFPLWSILACLGIGVVALVLYCRYVLNPGQDATVSYQHRSELRLLRAAIAQRPGALVSADDSQAIYAVAKPRRLWQASGSNRFGEVNHGLVRIDHGRRAILFEGNYERYCIPADAIVDCTLETPPTRLVTISDPWAVVVTARLGGGTWEFPFFPLANIDGENNWQRGAIFIDRIGQLCGRTFGDPVTTEPQPLEPATR